MSLPETADTRKKNKARANSTYRMVSASWGVKSVPKKLGKPMTSGVGSVGGGTDGSVSSVVVFAVGSTGVVDSVVGISVLYNHLCGKCI